MTLQLFADAEPGDTAYTYEEPGELIDGEFGWVTNLEYFDERYEEMKLVRKTWKLIAVEEIVLPDPNPPEDET